MSEYQDAEKFSWKLFLLKYGSRSFLCSIIGLVAFVYIAWSWGPEKIEASFKLGLIIGGLAGIFPLKQLFEKKEGAEKK